MVSTDADGYEGDSLELVTGAGGEELTAPAPEPGPERHTLFLGAPAPQPAPQAVPQSPTSPVPRDDVYLGDGDEIDLIDGVDPEPVFRPALIDTDEESNSMVIDQPDAAVQPDPVEVEDTLMAVDDYGDVP